MFSLLKLLRALNSAQAEYQLSLALVFGMISGFLPFFSLINLFIIFIVFTLNIPLGIFSIFTILFSMLGVALDPIFATIGYDLLKNPSLDSLFTSLYNNPIALWFSFNHTITLGSFLVSMILAIPLYFISKILFAKYRQGLEKVFKDNKFLSWLNPYNEKNLKSKPPLIRWWGSGIFIILFSLISLFIILLFDPIIKYSLEYVLSKGTKSNITINNVTTNIGSSTLEINDIVMIKDFKQNSIKKITLKINPDNLLRKKVDIELLNIIDINLKNKLIKVVSNNTKTNTKTAKNIKNKELPKITLDLPDIDTLLKTENIQSIKEAKEIKQRLINITNKWKDFSSKENTKKELALIQKDFDEIKLLSKNIKTMDDITKLLNKSNSLKDRLKLIQDKLNKYKKEYKSDKLTIKNDYKTAKTLPYKDYERLANKYSLDQNGAYNLVSTYISEDLVKYTKLFTKYYKLVKPYLPESEEEVEIVRLDGEYILFREINPYPTLVIQKLNFNLILKDSTYEAKAYNISDNMDILNKYPKAIIYGKSEEFKNLTIKIYHKIDTTISTNIEEINRKSIIVNEKLSLKNNSINLNSIIVIKGFTTLDANINTYFTKTNFVYNGANNKSEKMLSNILSNIDSFNIIAKVDSSLFDTKNMKYTIKSNLDKAITKGFTKEAKNQLNKYKVVLKDKLSKKVREQLGNMNQTDFDKYSKFLNTDSNSIDNMSNDLSTKYSQKALENKIQNEAQNKIKDKLQNKFKSLF